MELTKELFIAIIHSGNPILLHTLDRTTCGCGYCYYWVFQMDGGRFNPNVTEMDIELYDIKTVEALYEFVKDKANALHGNK